MFGIFTEPQGGQGGWSGESRRDVEDEVLEVRGRSGSAFQAMLQTSDFWVTWGGSDLKFDASELTEVLMGSLWLWRTDFSRAWGKEGWETSEKV